MFGYRNVRLSRYYCICLGPTPCGRHQLRDVDVLHSAPHVGQSILCMDLAVTDVKVDGQEAQGGARPGSLIRGKGPGTVYTNDLTQT